jgi:hypothetical protein
MLQDLPASSCAKLAVALLRVTELGGGYSDDECDYAVDNEVSLEFSQVLQLLRAVLQVPACQHMQADDIMSVLKVCLGPAWCTDCMPSCTKLLAEVGSDANPCMHGSSQGDGSAVVVEPVDLSRIAESFSNCCCHQHGALMVLLTVRSLPAAAYITLDQLVALLTDACKAFASVCVWRLLMQLPAAQQLVRAQVAAVLSSLFDTCCAKGGQDRTRGFGLGCVVGVLLQHPVGQQLTGEDVVVLCVSLVQQPFQKSLLAVVGQLLWHPAGQQLSADTLAHLMQITVWQDDNIVALAFLFLQHSGAVSMTADCGARLLQLLAGHKGSCDAVSQLLCLPAAQQLSLSQIKPVLWQACQFGDRHIFEALCALPAGTAARDDPELQLVLATAALDAVELGPSYCHHRVRIWCTCSACRPEQ